MTLWSSVAVNNNNIINVKYIKSTDDEKKRFYVIILYFLNVIDYSEGISKVLAQRLKTWFRDENIENKYSELSSNRPVTITK